MLAGHAPEWRKSWEQAAGCIADVITVRTSTARRGDGVVRLGPSEYEIGLLKLQPERLLHGAAGVVMRRRLQAALGQIERDHGPVDVCHAHFYSAALHADALGVPYVVSEHTTVFTRAERPAVVRRSLHAAQKVYEHAAMVLPVSTTLEEDMRRAGVRGRLRVVPNPIDVATFMTRDHVPASHEVRVLFAQRLASTKGVDTLLRAMRTACVGDPRLRLRIAGAGPERERLETLTHALDLGHRVTFLGHLDRPELLRELREAHLLAFPSRGDSFGLPVVEALAMGVPVVATPQGVVPEVLTPDKGQVVPVDDVRALAGAILDVARWAPTADPRRVAAGIPERFSPAAVADQLRDVYALALR